MEKKELKKLKAWIVYGGSPEWYNATLIFENGWAAFRHLCSHPCYMIGDLIENRQRRKDVLAKMGYKVDLQDNPIAGSDDDRVAHLIPLNANKNNWQEMQDQYKKTELEMFGDNE